MTQKPQVFIGVDPGHATGWGIIENESGVPCFRSCGVIPVYLPQEKVFAAWSFWKAILDQYSGWQIFICTEVNIGSAFATSVFFVQWQAMSNILLHLLDQQLKKYDIEFLDIKPASLGACFGITKSQKVKRVKGEPIQLSGREKIRIIVQEQYGLDRAALNKSIDAWDGLIIAQAGYYIKHERRTDMTYITCCKTCGLKILVNENYHSCDCGAVSAMVERLSGKLNLLLRDKKKGLKNLVVVKIGDSVLNGESETGFVEKADLGISTVNIIYR